MRSTVFNLDVPRKVTGILKKNLDLDQDREEIAHYALDLVWSFILNILAIGFLAYLAGVLPQAVLGGLTAALVRLFAGGAHAGSPWRCALVGAVVLTVFGRLAIYLAAVAPGGLPYFTVSSTLLVLAAVWLWAPVDSPAKPITSPRQRGNLRLLSIAAVLAAGLVETALIWEHSGFTSSLAFVLGLCLLWQGFSLTRSGHSLLGKLDHMLSLGRKEVS